MRLLLVEDEPNIAKPVVRALLAQGHAVRHAPDLATARDLFLETEPDLILLDVRLPESEDGGFVFAREARAAGYSGPILFMTARDALEDRVTGLDEGGDDYVVKPFDLPKLLARVRALLRRVHEARTSRIELGEPGPRPDPPHRALGGSAGRTLEPRIRAVGTPRPVAEPHLQPRRPH